MTLVERATAASWLSRTSVSCSASCELVRSPIIPPEPGLALHPTMTAVAVATALGRILMRKLLRIGVPREKALRLARHPGPRQSGPRCHATASQ